MSENKELLDYLRNRRTVTASYLAEPGPNAEQLQELLTIASRVPDHGKLAPWRFVVIQGDARAQAGEKLGEIARRVFPDKNDDQIEADAKQFMHAPLTIGVISSPKPHPKVPEFEQLLAAGNAAFNLTHAANALGFAAHWVTRWYAFNAEAATMLGAKDGERFVGFIYVGTPTQRLEDRDRPDVSTLTQYWSA